MRGNACGLLWAGLAVCVACGSEAPRAASAPPPGFVPPTVVAVILHGAVIAPTKSDGKAWDVDLGSADPGLARQLVSVALTQATPYAFVLDAFQQPCAAAIARPDPYGSAELESAAGVAQRPLPMVKDTFNPLWSSARWDGVVLTPSTRLRVALWDKDLQFDDPIGEAVIDERALLAAMSAGSNYPIQVDRQTAGQVLFVDVEVLAEGGAPAVAFSPR